MPPVNISMCLNIFVILLSVKNNFGVTVHSYGDF